MSILHRIADSQRAQVARRRRERPLRELRASIDPALAPRGSFASALRRGPEGQVHFICEIKRASPTAGVLRETFDAEGLARAYAAGGAAAISVVTEERFFLGTPDTLRQVRQAVGQPVLMKDFVIDPYQIVEALVLGADAILLIASLLSPNDLKRFLEQTGEVGLECLVEVHDEAELESALGSGAPVVGVNNRDLVNFQVDLGTTERLSRLMPADRVLVSESGIRTRDDILRLEQSPVDAVLIGETLMRADSPAQALGRLMGH
jgi:indole-3-glycerol phosphate synthase